MDEFIENIRLVLGALGYRLLEPIAEDNRSDDDDSKATDSAEVDDTPHLDTTFHFETGEAEATGELTDEGFLVHQGSTACKDDVDSLHDTYVRARRELLEDGTLRDTGDVYEFTEDLLCSSPTYAAAVVAGSVRSGPGVWQDPDGKSLREREEELSEMLTEGGDAPGENSSSRQV